MDPTDEPDAVAEAIRQLRGAGWSVGIVPFVDWEGARAWLVTGHRGGRWLMAQGATRGDAWGRAVEEARSLGMLGR
jgi:hypothetical protein